MKNIPNKLLLSILMVLFLIPACKKDQPAKPVALSRSFDLKVSAATPLSISIAVTRPSGSMTINIDVIGLGNIASPYEYQPTNVQAGDKVAITLKTTQNQPITSSLTINGSDVTYTSSTLSDPTGLSAVSWNTTVN
jgi:hypothetical protein